MTTGLAGMVLKNNAKTVAASNARPAAPALALAAPVATAAPVDPLGQTIVLRGASVRLVPAVNVGQARIAATVVVGVVPAAPAAQAARAVIVGAVAQVAPVLTHPSHPMSVRISM